LSIVIAKTVLGSSEIENINKLVKDIKKERIGLSKADTNSAKNPFVKAVKKIQDNKPMKVYRRKKYSKKFSLNAIVNKKAKVNNRWYSINSTVYGYKIIKIKDNYVVLEKGNTEIYLYLKEQKNRKIKFSSY